jgi:hypothetical protein
LPAIYMLLVFTTASLEQNGTLLASESPRGTKTIVVFLNDWLSIIGLDFSSLCAFLR